MGLFKKNNNINNELILDEDLINVPKNHMKDDWVRSDYILVSNKTSAKDLKPYQRMVVLRKPSGQQKYIIDKSLPYSEIKKIQSLIEKRKPVDINSNKIKRIIPNEYKTYEEISDDDILVNEYENDLKVLKDLNVGEFNEHLVDNEITSLLKLEDDYSRVSLKSKNNISGVSDVDIIDSVKIYIPHEERKIKWNTIDGKEIDEEINKLVENESTEFVEEPINLSENDELPLDSNYEIHNNELEENSNIDDEIVNDEVFANNEEPIYENYESNLSQDDLQVSENNYDVNDEYQFVENQEKDYDGEILTTDTYVEKPKQTITSFFKNEIEISNYAIQDQERRNNYYGFYNDTNNMPMEKVVLNKKLNMFTMRKKIDKNLIEEKNRKY